MSQLEHELQKIGLYAGNVILELEPDVKGIKPKIKVNNLATEKEMEQALNNFSYLCEQTHLRMQQFGLPVTYLMPVKEKIPVKSDKGEVKINAE